ncbi:hypothetical protein EON81_18630, partial [bacterium]
HRHPPDGGARGAGPYALVWLAIADERILNVAFQTNGCRWAIACGEAAGKLVKGRTVEQATQLSPSDLGLLLGGLPTGKEAAAERAVSALRAALRMSS